MSIVMCEICGRKVDTNEEAVAKCPKCDRDVCINCSSSCDICGETFCDDCLAIDTTEDKFCGECWKKEKIRGIGVKLIIDLHYSEKEKLTYHQFDINGSGLDDDVREEVAKKLEPFGEVYSKTLMSKLEDIWKELKE